MTPCRMIGVMGSGPGTGVTHLCVLAANYLAGACQRRTAVMEWNSHGDFEQMRKICLGCPQTGQAEAGAERPPAGFSVLGVTYYREGGRLAAAACMDGRYQDMVVDFGEYSPAVREEWMRCQIRLGVVSLSEWQLEPALKMMAREGKGRGWTCLAAFGSEETRKEVQKRLGTVIVRIPFAADAFRIDQNLIRWFRKILR